MTRLADSTVLVLGGAGLVGQAICRALMDARAGCVVVGGLTEQEARDATAALTNGAVPHAASATELVPVWGSVFARADLAVMPAAPAHPTARERALRDDLAELTDDIYRASHLVQLVLGTSPLATGRRPDIVVDAINTATALAYTGMYGRLQHALDRDRAAGAEALDAQIDGLLAAFAIPRLVRHVQLLSRCTMEAGTACYVKVGTTGTGGMGLNIPYTHGEERPSRVLLSKAALSGAHSSLLFLLARTPGAPAVKEIKPAAAITWKRIAHGPIAHRGKPLALYDCPLDEAVPLSAEREFELEGCGRRLAGHLESVFIDTGENGLFSIGEFTTVTALGQMEAVTPQDIATLVLREIRGQSTGRDIVAALDSAVTPPSYRAGRLRDHAIAEARALADEKEASSVAFELLGPPRLSKLLYEAELLRLAFPALDDVAAAAPDAIVTCWLEALRAHDKVRRAAISVGVPILLPEGNQLLCATRELRQHRWEQPGWRPDTETLERWAHAEWIDLRHANATRWGARARAIVAERDRDAADPLRSSVLDRRFLAATFDIGEVAAWVLANEDGGYRP